MIKCKWQQNNKFVINPDGQVIPCCYLANILYNDPNQHGIMAEYIANKLQYNIFHRPVLDILQSDWFVETLPESWQSEDTTHSVCKRWCNVTNKKSSN